MISAALAVVVLGVSLSMRDWRLVHGIHATTRLPGRHHPPIEGPPTRACVHKHQIHPFTRNQMNKSLRYPLYVVAVIAACNEPASLANLPNAADTARVAHSLTTCDATVTLITEEYDPTEATYGWNPQSDTIDVCAAWTGSDYRARFRTLGTTERHYGPYDMTRNVEYEWSTMRIQSGTSTVYSDPVSGGLVDAYNADAGTRAAIADDPWYALRSMGGTVHGGCCALVAGNVSTITSQEDSGRADVSRAPATYAPIRDGRFTRHGLSRRGIRALVEAAAEVSPPGAARRRFRWNDATGDHVRVIDRKSELLVGEESVDDEVKLVATHDWQPTASGYLRSRTVMEVRALRGNALLARSEVRFKDVQIREP